MTAWWHATQQPGKVPSERALGFALRDAGFEKKADRKDRRFYAITLPQRGLKVVAA
jgi:hypothetical protein